LTIISAGPKATEITGFTKLSMMAT
jgi:hypothetical protein